jgi:SAM-dependent methyltransferase
MVLENVDSVVSLHLRAKRRLQGSTIKPWNDHLHLGCGLTAPKGWLNVDNSWQVVLARHPWIKQLLVSLRLFPRKQAELPWNAELLRVNLIGKLPFPDESFQAIYCSHTLEHLYSDNATLLLHECHRVLQRGGVCRFVVPDLESIVARYQKAKAEGDPEASTRLMEELMLQDKKPNGGPLGFYRRLTSFNQHKWMYDAASLEALFARAGFGEIRKADYLDSRINRIAEVESAGRILNGEGVVVEGVKT